jgi:hypothetical protein
MEKKINTLKTQDNSLWKLARNLKNKKSPPPPLTHEGRVYTADKDKAMIFGDMLRARFQHPPLNDADTNIIDTCTSFLRAPASEPTLCSMAELRALLNSLPTNKAPGPDEIPPKAIKLLPPDNHIFLLQLINTCIYANYFPEAWKNSKIIVLPKPRKDLTNPNNHRPISLTSFLSKILEKCIQINLQNHFFPLQTPFQAGFTPRTSTIHQIARLTDQIHLDKAHDRLTTAAFLDIDKAFDKVWHLGLINKLIEAEFPSYLIKMIHSFLENRTFHISHNNFTSQTYAIKAGVPQGAVLSPTPYNIYTNDIPTTPNTKRYLFANDSTIKATHRWLFVARRHIQTHLDQLQTWAD